MSRSSYISDKYSINVRLLTNVTNSKQLRKSLMEGKIPAAVLKASLIVDEFHLLMAANKALKAHLQDKRITKTLQSEVLYSLAPNKNISDCFRRFGIGDKDTNIVIVEICETDQSKMEEIVCQVEGEEVSLDNLSKMNDIEEIKKVYKIEELELTVGSLCDAVVSRMATKDFINF